ncbi:MAG: leucyl/phenylalanyl-tRNA--protein transferase [Alphaproteobacteria bacterium]|nr:leucyl/phenylalanyl-tRNA--protein transferase [Alphaproteobacteria bacterium]
MGELTPEDILDAYQMGLFPMAEHATDEDVYWVSPVMRGVIPLDGFHVSHSLRKFLKRRPFRVTINRAFGAVMAGCAAQSEGRDETWINSQILQVYNTLHNMGYTHSIECWDEENALVGGLYGVAINGAFFGESMFSRVPNASKVALVHLVTRLKLRGYRLLDCQFLNEHLKQFGCIEIPREEYHSLLAGALSAEGVSFVSASDSEAGSSAMYSSSAASVAEGASAAGASSVGPDSVPDSGVGAVLSCDSDWDVALGSLQSSTVTS